MKAAEYETLISKLAHNPPATDYKNHPDHPFKPIYVVRMCRDLLKVI